MQKTEEGADLLRHLEHDARPVDANAEQLLTDPQALQRYAIGPDDLVLMPWGRIEAVIRNLDKTRAVLSEAKKALAAERGRRQCRDFILCFAATSLAGWWLLKVML
jgi:hypothetical protein